MGDMRAPRVAAAAAASAVAATTAVLLWGEYTQWRASRRLLGNTPRTAGPHVVVVLGWGNRGTHANAVNRYRVRAALRTLPPGGLLVTCGGPVEGPVPEADLLAAYARERGYAGPIVRDRTSRTTWENVRNAIPYLEGAGTIAVVSDAVHAEKARAHLWAQRPDLADRLVRGREYRFGEVAWMKPLASAVGRHRMRKSLIIV